MTAQNNLVIFNIKLYRPTLQLKPFCCRSYLFHINYKVFFATAFEWKRILYNNIELISKVILIGQSPFCHHDKKPNVITDRLEFAYKVTSYQNLIVKNPKAKLRFQGSIKQTLTTLFHQKNKFVFCLKAFISYWVLLHTFTTDRKNSRTIFS